ncbi:hypothetical protein BRADI_1g26757v3 [Brachypodium distachyon]|uniref:Reverse transcriptase zinc-binding domain-containing protein n=1 Tax=Brachypodium distachyon TaxID=15368 RepID=A0A0Q3GYN2_BRADI|nr:hypothetical protein BRADI_1g26757v3 [Brachypodium distachyon]
METFNQALLARQAWRLIDKPTSLCARVLKAKYYPNGSLVDTVFTGNTSSSWQAIEFGLELVKKGIIWRVGNGESVRIWRDPWIPRDFSRRPITPRRSCRLKWVSELLTQDGSWNMDLLANYFLPVDIEYIIRIRSSPRNEEDLLAWHPDKRGLFSVRSAYHLGCVLAPEGQNLGATSSRPDGSSTKWKVVWNEFVPRKVNIFAWKLARDALPTQVNFCKRKMKKIRTCPLCGVEDEDSFHALVRCPNARALWHAMRSCWDIPDDSQIQNTGAEWFLQVLSNLDNIKAAMLLMLLWRIWHVHNDITHDKTPAPVEASKRFLCSYLDSLLAIKQHSEADFFKGKQVVAYSARLRSRYRRTNSAGGADDRWKPPNADSVKLNVDGSFSSNDGSAGVGLVLRDHRGNLMISACCNLPQCNDALEAELAACEEGLRASIGWTDKLIILESDCAEGLSLVNAKALDISPYALPVREIRRLLDEHPVTIRKVSRHQNCRSTVEFGRDRGEACADGRRWLRRATAADCAVLEFEWKSGPAASLEGVDEMERMKHGRTVDTRAAVAAEEVADGTFMAEAASADVAAVLEDGDAASTDG